MSHRDVAPWLKRVGRSRINVAIIGCGWFGGGLARELFGIENMVPAILVDLVPERAIKTLAGLGVEPQEISMIRRKPPLLNGSDDREEDAHMEFDTGDPNAAPQYIVCDDVEALAGMGSVLSAINIIFEATGDVWGGTRAALLSLDNGIPFLTTNAEMMATVGVPLSGRAQTLDVPFAFSRGDQPGSLVHLINEVGLWGFVPKIAGNCKGFLDAHQTPLGVGPYVPEGHNARNICSFADGTKQSLEMAVVANALGYSVVQRGMVGPMTSKVSLIDDFCSAVDLQSSEDCYVDYVTGIDGDNQGGGIFVIAFRKDGRATRDLAYLKIGRGPFYLFFRDYHLCYFEAVSSILEVLGGASTFSMEKEHCAVLAVAKRDIPADHRLDGIGGYDCYGVIERSDMFWKQQFLPVGLASYATTVRPLASDQPITLDDVSLEDCPMVKFWSTQVRRGLEASDSC